MKKYGTSHLYQVIELNVTNNGRNKQYLLSDVMYQEELASWYDFLVKNISSKSIHEETTGIFIWGSFYKTTGFKYTDS